MPSSHPSCDGLNAMHAATREPRNRHPDPAAAGGGAGRDLKLILKINVDVHQDLEHDMLMMSRRFVEPG
jgi:hypothetical protein